MAIADAGDDGATDNELTDLLRPPGGQNNLRPRRGELVESGYVTDAGIKRPTPSGSQATVWRLSTVDRPTLTRSEEHTSELQSLMRISYAVFCLKKKKAKTK